LLAVGAVEDAGEVFWMRISILSMSTNHCGGDWWVGGLTLATRIGLHEFVAGAGLLELRGQPGQLRQGFVDQPDLGG
jgi:hypothetical protein